MKHYNTEQLISNGKGERWNFILNSTYETSDFTHKLLFEYITGINEEVF